MKLHFNLFAVIWFLLDHGVSGVGSDRVSVKEGDSVTLHTGVQTNHQEDIKWYFSGFLLAHISGDQSKICTDVQCNEGTERFRDRLKLDHQTGSLTITNFRNTDAGVYELQIFSSSDSEKFFNVTVQSVSAAEQNEMKSVKEGESVTLDPGLINNPNDLMRWYFNEIVIAEITGDQSKICTDDQCEERFRDRLKLDHQTGSLTITNTRNTDSGEYQLQINSKSSSFSFRRIRSFSVTVTAHSADAVLAAVISSINIIQLMIKAIRCSDLSSAAVAGIVVAVVLLVVAVTVGVIYCRRRIHTAIPQTENDKL